MKLYTYRNSGYTWIAASCTDGCFMTTEMGVGDEAVQIAYEEFPTTNKMMKAMNEIARPAYWEISYVDSITKPISEDKDD